MSHVNERPVLRAAGFYCSGASQGLGYRGVVGVGGAQPLSPHMICLQPVGVFRQVHVVNFTTSDQMIDRGMAGNMLARYELGFKWEVLAGHGGVMRLCSTDSGPGRAQAVGSESKEELSKYDFDASTFKIRFNPTIAGNSLMSSLQLFRISWKEVQHRPSVESTAWISAH